MASLYTQLIHSPETLMSGRIKEHGSDTSERYFHKTAPGRSWLSSRSLHGGAVAEDGNFLVGLERPLKLGSLL